MDKMTDSTFGTTCPLCRTIIPFGTGHACSKSVVADPLPCLVCAAHLERIAKLEDLNSRAYHDLGERTEALVLMEQRCGDVDGMAKVIKAMSPPSLAEHFPPLIARAVSAWLKETP